MATVCSTSAPVNRVVSVPFTATTSPAIAPASRAALYHALAKASSRAAEAARDSLPAGSAYIAALNVSGTIDGQPVSAEINGMLTVGHDVTKASSSTPDLPTLLGNVLAKLNTATRAAILRELPEAFAANGCKLPAVPEGIADATAEMLKRLRAEKQVTSRGAVCFKQG